jgi:hypothetical protein
MDRLNLKSSWEEVRERLKENDITLTDQDLEYKVGDDEALIERLAAKMNKSKKETREYIESVSANQDKSG